ncbi:hypothetical protein ASD64_10625 [Mesorhizobium sp. Root157]|nr:hypothetical protein ASD64_10625 [Mesorhizobium sp. Root157]
MKVGLAALCLVAGLSVPAMAGPAPVSSPALPAAGQSGIVLVRDGDWREQYQDRRWWRMRQGDWRRHYREDRRWRRPHYRSSGLYFSFGLGAPAYRYYAEPRRYYQPQRIGNAHVIWCYSRYRSYRAYDNTFQPYNGPRRQCWSPYR